LREYLPNLALSERVLNLEKLHKSYIKSEIPGYQTLPENYGVYKVSTIEMAEPERPKK